MTTHRWGLLLVVLVTGPAGAQETLVADAKQALHRAITFYRTQVAQHDGYGYYTSVALDQRWGEGKLAPTTIVVQPPGTPTVGLAYLAAYRATGTAEYLTAARTTAKALLYGQLQSGGWTQMIHFAPAERRGKYRNGQGGAWNASSLDDGQTQAALQFLMQADAAHEFRDAELHAAVEYGLDALLQAQFANGAFPQVWTGPVAAQPIRAARLPDYDWKTVGRVKNYWDYYTLNDDLAGSVAETLITAHTLYRAERYRAALLRLGDFLCLAQMPAPQPGWCQQYNYEMHPIWARKFEPPALAGRESFGVCQTLARIAQYTGVAKYRAPIAAAKTYFTTRCVLPNGQTARYYELGSNRPLYLDANYRLTYDANAAPAHYGWQHPLDWANAEVVPAAEQVSAERVRQIIRDLDAEGRWVSTYAGEPLVGQPKFAPGFRYLSSAVFSAHVTQLSQFVAAHKP